VADRAGHDLGQFLLGHDHLGFILSRRRRSVLIVGELHRPQSLARPWLVFGSLLTRNPDSLGFKDFHSVWLLAYETSPLPGLCSFAAIAIVAFVLASLPLWRRRTSGDAGEIRRHGWRRIAAELAPARPMHSVVVMCFWDILGTTAMLEAYAPRLSALSMLAFALWLMRAASATSGHVFAAGVGYLIVWPSSVTARCLGDIRMLGAAGMFFSAACCYWPCRFSGIAKGETPCR